MATETTGLVLELLHLWLPVRNVTDRTRNPFGMAPPCDEFVPGYGDANADFHVVGDHPGVHGGRETRIPFTDRPWSPTFFDALVEATLVEGYEPDWRDVTLRGTFLSYLHACVSEGDGPDARSRAAMEPFFDAELRAITADVLLPVGARATAHVLREFTARDPRLAEDMDALHGTELRGSGWLVVPVTDPVEWTDGVARRLVNGLLDLQRTDYHRLADLGRFGVGNEPYYVR